MLVPTSPVPETLLAARLLWRRRGGARFNPWRHYVRGQLGPRAHSLTSAVQSVRITAELFTSSSQGLDEELLGRVCGPEEIAAVQQFGRVATIPPWRRIRTFLEAERSSRCQDLLAGGLEGMLSSLHQSMAWNPPNLEIAGHPGGRIILDSSGLLIVPSLFLVDQPTLFFGHRATPSFDRVGPDTPPVLTYPVPINSASAKLLWSISNHSKKNLGALVGATRAEALHSLVDSSSTGELGQRLGISAAAASQHTTVLRNAGLITTRRGRNTVSHSLTRLGLALLNGDTFDETPPQAS